MKSRFLIKVFAALLLSASASTAHALSIVLSPANATIAVGDQVSLDVVIDFTGDPTIGGGMDIAWNALGLTFVSWDFSTSTVNIDPAFSRNPDIFPGLAESIGAGNFVGLAETGILGTITLQALVPGTFGVVPSDTNGIAGPWVSATTFQQQNPGYSGAQIEVTNGAQVPGPAALLLLLVGLAGIASRMRLSR